MLTVGILQWESTADIITIRIKMANDWVCKMPLPEAGESYIIQMGTVELSGNLGQLGQEVQMILSNKLTTDKHYSRTTVMRYDFLGRGGRVARILVLVVVFVFNCAQSLAQPRFGLSTNNEPDLNLENDSNGIIEYRFSIDVINPSCQFRLSFSDTPINQGFVHSSEPPQSLIITTLTKNEHTNSSLVTVNQIGITYDPFGFNLGSWSNLQIVSGFDPKFEFTIKFSRHELEKWVQESTEGTLRFYVVASFECFGPYGPMYKLRSSEVEIPIKQVEYAYVIAPEDIELPQEPSTDFRGFCVSSTTKKVSLEFQGIRSDSEFLLKASDSNNSHSIGYKIELKGKIGGHGKQVTLDRPGKLDGEYSVWDANKALTSNSGCTGDNNMALRIDFQDQSVADNAPPGEYTDEVTITVAPAS